LEVKKAARHSLEASILHLPAHLRAEIMQPFVRKLLKDAASCPEAICELDQSAVLFGLVRQVISLALSCNS